MFLGIVWNLSCMIPRLPGPYTSLCRSVALLCLIGLGRSRVISYHSRDIGCFRSQVISGYSRDIGCFYISLYELLYSRWNEENWRPDGGMMMRCRYGNRTGFLCALAPSVSIKDRTLLALLIEFKLY